MFPRPKIVIDRDIPYMSGVLDPYFDLTICAGSQIDRDLVRDAKALIIRTRTKCNASLLEGSEVKLIATATIGADHIDSEYCAANNIKVVNAPGCNSAAVMQYFYTALYQLAHLKKMPLSGKTIGVIGVGNVGGKVADFGERLGFRVLRNDPYREGQEHCQKDFFCTLDYLLAHSDIVTLHIPLWKDNVNFADDRFFAAMNEGAIFVNASRGEVVVEEALLGARGKLGGVVIDVWRGEPAINRDLLAAADIATPHIAGYSKQGKINGTVAVVRGVARHFGIEPLTNFALEDARCNLSFEGKSQSEVLDLLLSLYPIMEDDRALRAAPEEFEKLRSQYNYRIEYVY